MTYANVAAAAGSVIAITFLVVALIILAGLIRTRQLRRNPLGTVVAIIFLVSAAHQALLVLPVVPQIAPGNHILDPANAVLAVLTALIGLMFLALRSQYGAIVLATPRRRSRRRAKDFRGARADAVTGLPGADQAREFLGIELAEALHAREPVCLLMIHLDLIQRRPDDSDQGAGDILLGHVGALLRNQLRKGDCSARSSDSEFMVVMPAVGREGAFRVAQRLEIKVQRLIGDLLIETPVAVCTGIATCPEDATDTEGLVAAAEEAMNYSRRLGGGHFFYSEDVGLLEADIDSSVEPVSENTTQSVNSLMAALAAHDPGTVAHSERVAAYAVAIAERLKYPAEGIPLLRIGALLHDVGMIGVSPEILRKPGRLTAAEYLEVRRHPIIGYKMTRNLPGCQVPSIYVLYHHETWAGHGYPEALHGEEIPLASRIIAVAEAFDMMHSHRPHREALPLAECRRRLLGGAGTQFDPQIVSVMIPLASRQLVAGADGSAAARSNGHSAAPRRRRVKP
jgi:diguanylate cyclase (GGDEF)-like protein